MKFLNDEDDVQFEKIAGVDVAEIAALLARVNFEGDAYDVLQNVLATLTRRIEEPRGTTLTRRIEEPRGTTH